MYSHREPPNRSSRRESALTFREFRWSGLTSAATRFLESTRRIRWAGLALTLCLFGFLLPASGQDTSIVTQPADQTNLHGSDATFCVTASGTPPLSYQWRHDLTAVTATNLPGETNACLVMTNVEAALNNWRFTVVVCNPSGCVTSRQAKLTVRTPPYFTSQPTNQIVCLGETYTDNVAAGGDQPLRLQWYLVAGGVTNLLPGRTASTLSIPNIQFTNAGWYFVVATNLVGTNISRVASLQVEACAPAIVVQPASATVEVGRTYTNRVVASGTMPLSYQWYFVPDGTTTTNLLVGQTNKTLSIANIQFTNAGGYSVVVTNLYGSEPSVWASLTVKPATFVKITTGAIVTDGDYHAGASWCDYDGDGFQDLFVPNGGSFTSNSKQNSLYHNNGDGTFTKTTNDLTATFGHWKCGVWADVDNDGDPDVYVGAAGDNSDSPSVFYRNDGGGRFTAVSIVPTVDAASRDSIILSWGDYDQDGWVDLFMPSFTHPGNHHLFRNLGDLNFKSMTAAEVGDLVSPAAHQGSPMGTWIDYDNDGGLDIYVWGNVNALHLNSGSGFFTRTFTGSITTVTDGPASWADYDNDGYLDLFVPRPSGAGINALHHNLGGTNSVEVTQAAGLDRPMNTFSGSWGDYDNDGNLDLFVVNNPYWVGQPVRRSANMLYRGNGDGTFTEVDVGSPIWEPRDDWEPFWIDYDNDGFLDLFIFAGSFVPEVNYLYRNNLPATGNTNHWLKVSLVGKASNASGIGAKVRVTANIRGKTVTQLRAIESPGYFGSNQGLLAHFGLGDATNITTLRIEWPSGIVQELHDVTANQPLTVVESQNVGAAPQFSGVTKSAGGLQISFTEPATPARYILEASSDLVAWTKLMARTSAGATTNYLDSRMTNYPSRF